MPLYSVVVTQIMRKTNFIEVRAESRKKALEEASHIALKQSEKIFLKDQACSHEYRSLFAYEVDEE